MELIHIAYKLSNLMTTVLKLLLSKIKQKIMLMNDVKKDELIGN